MRNVVFVIGVILILQIEIILGQNTSDLIIQNSDDTNTTELQNRHKEKQQAELKKFRYTVYLAQKDTTKRNFCDGCLLSKYWVITLNSCFDVNGTRRDVLNTTVIAGMTSLSSTSLENQLGIQMKDGHLEYPCPKVYAPRGIEPDLLLLKVKEPFTMTDYVQWLGYTYQDWPINTTCFLSGWGIARHESLKYAITTVTHMNSCRLLTEDLPTQQSLICGRTGQPNCFRNSGAPLVCKNILYGVLYRNPCNPAKKNWTTDRIFLYESVYYYREWIEDCVLKKKCGSRSDRDSASVVLPMSHPVGLFFVSIVNILLYFSA